MGCMSTYFFYFLVIYFQGSYREKRQTVPHSRVTEISGLEKLQTESFWSSLDMTGLIRVL